MRGQQVCVYHGGSTKRSRDAATRRLQMAEIRKVLGIPEEIDPAEALIEQVHVANGNERYLRAKVQSLGGDYIQTGLTGDGVNVLVKLWNEERERLTKFSKLAVDAGIAERQVRMKEQEAQMLVGLFIALIDSPSWGLTGRQRMQGRQVASQLLQAHGGALRAVSGVVASEPLPAAELAGEIDAFAS